MVITADALLAHVLAGEAVTLDQWSVGPFDGHLWLTNPYGVDVAFFDMDIAGCEKALNIISEDTSEREWF